MKCLSLIFLFSLSPLVLAQTLPDEINYPPYQARYQELARRTSEAQSQLSQSQNSLAEARRFMREMTEHIASLRQEISQDQSEINRLQQLIPQLERALRELQSQRGQVESEIRTRQSEANSLENSQQQALRDLRPLENDLNRREDVLRSAQAGFSQQQGQLRDAEARLAQAEAQITRLAAAIEQERREQRQLQQDLSSIESRIADVQRELSDVSSQQGNIDSQLARESAKLQALNQRIQDAQAELANLRSQNAPADQISSAERKLGAITQTRDNTSSEVSALRQQSSQLAQQVSRLETQASSLRRDQAGLPRRIEQSQAQERELQNQQSLTKQELVRAEVESHQLRERLERLTSIINQQRQEVRQGELAVARQRELVDALRRKIDEYRQLIGELQNDSLRLSSQIADQSETLRDNQNAIPTLQQKIRDAQSEIAQGESDIAQAHTDESNLLGAITRETQVLADITRTRDASQREYDQRSSLYQRYLGEARALGDRQTTEAVTLGEQEGPRLADSLSQKNAQSVGRELGVSQAKLWGSVRGELQGYDLGFIAGNTSIEETTKAEGEARAQAQKDADVFAQVQFKPVFFEEFVQAAFQAPVTVPKRLSAKMLFSELTAPMVVNATIEPLTPAELARSQTLKTPLDQAIEQLVQTEKSIIQKARRLSDPQVAFVAPTSIPLGRVECQAVYKNQAVFIKACQDSYLATFTQIYLKRTKDTFTERYTDLFEGIFTDVTIAVREENFPAELSAAQVVGESEGLRVGKQENYNRTYAQTYPRAYEAELPVAREKSKLDARRELTDFLGRSALLTLHKTQLSASDFRGGAMVEIQGQVKNVGQQAFAGASLVRITAVEKGSIIKGEAVLNQAIAQGLSDLPALKVQVNPSAKTGEKLVVRGAIELPGDLYKPARQEKFELTQILSANPAHRIDLSYNKTPSIKGVFRRNIHFLTSKIKPTVEDVAGGYSLSLTATGEHAALIEIRDSSFNTGPLAVNAVKEGRFSYVFRDAAKNKRISLVLAISYAGKVIAQETIELKPD